MNPDAIFGALPNGLREPLLDEYHKVVRNYAERRWLPSELSGGRFCEIVYAVIDGYASGTFLTRPSKPRDFVAACRKFEQFTHMPRGFRILIPRILPAIYEIRNNRGVGHAGGDVDSNYMDATFVVSNCSWVLAELIRVYHGVTVQQAQSIVDGLVQRRVPLVWEGNGTRRVLAPRLNLRSQILILLATSSGPMLTAELLAWIEYRNLSYFKKLLRDMHSHRLVELSDNEECVELLPPGDVQASQIIEEQVKATDI